MVNGRPAWRRRLELGPGGRLGGVEKAGFRAWGDGRAVRQAQGPAGPVTPSEAFWDSRSQLPGPSGTEEALGWCPSLGPRPSSSL